MHGIAGAWGRLIARYSRHVLTSDSIRPVFETPLTPEPCVWVGWHEANMISLMVHRVVVRRPVAAFVPGGQRGIAMAEWLEELGIMPIPLRRERDAGHALRRMIEALRQGSDVMIAVDGPRGPRRRAKAGAIWLAGASGAAVCPVGVGAVSAARLPRWDCLIVPLPGAKVRAVFGGPLILRSGSRSGADLSQLDRALEALTARASAALYNRREDGLREAA